MTVPTNGLKVNCLGSLSRNHVFTIHSDNSLRFPSSRLIAIRREETHLDANQRELIEVLRAAKGLLSIDKNDFAWSRWEGAEDALKELDGLIDTIEAGKLLERLDVSLLFAATGPIQEVSLSSGWSKEFLALAARFDAVEFLLFPQSREGKVDGM